MGVVHPGALSCSLGQVVHPVSPGAFESMSGRGDVEEIEPGLFDSNGDTILLYSRVFMIAST